MDTFNDLYPPFPDNPEPTSDEEYVERGRKRKRLTFDDFCAIYSDELWHLWCIIDDFKKDNRPILNGLDYPRFCSLCFENT